jgi:hypothetical protein
MTAQQLALGLFVLGSLCFVAGNVLLLVKAVWP